MMKNFSMEENMSLEKIKTKLWSILKVFKKENISSYDYHVLLFFLSAYKDGILSADLIDGKHTLNVNLNERLDNSNTELSNQYRSIIHVFEPSMQRLSDIGLKDVFNKIAAINRQVLTDNFTFLFNSVLFRISQSQGRYAGEFIQSVELTRLMCNLADLEKSANVFNPFAGIASFNIFLSQDQNYLGQELDQKTWALGKLRLLAYGRIENARYDNDDSIYNWPNSSNKFDLIISNPPIGLDLRSHNIGGKFIHTYRRVEQLLIERSIENLSPTGKLITIVPLSFLQRTQGEEHILANLIDNDLIETIISLPGGLLVNTGIPITILVLNKAKKMPGKVKLIDAKKFVVSKGPREKVLDDYALEHFIRSNKEDDSIIRIVDNEQIRNNDYNLSVPRYFRKEIDGVRLGDMLEYVRGNSEEQPEAGKLIQMRDLKNDKVDFTLNTSSVLIHELKRPNIYSVKETCLLVANRGITLKPTLFEFKGEPIFISQDIQAFKVDEAIADNAYLIYELHKDYVQEQLDSYRMGASIPFIRTKDLMEIVIKLPKISDQRKKVLEDKLAFIRIEEERIKQIRLKHDLIIEDDSSVLRHLIKGPLKNLSSSIDGINKIISSQISATLPSVFDLKKSSTSSFTLGRYLEIINREISFLSEITAKKYETKKADEFIDIPFLKFIKDYTIELRDSISLKPIQYEINSAEKIFDETYIIEGNIKEVIISGDESDLKVMLHNLEDNAIKHGFKNQSIMINKIEIVCEIDHASMTLRLKFSNSGNKLPKDFSKQDFIRNGVTSDITKGNGDGGSLIDKIINNHKGEFNISDLSKDDPDNDYVTSFIVQLPIKDIVSNN